MEVVSPHGRRRRRSSPATRRSSTVWTVKADGVFKSTAFSVRAYAICVDRHAVALDDANAQRHTKPRWRRHRGSPRPGAHPATLSHDLDGRARTIGRMSIPPGPARPRAPVVLLSGPQRGGQPRRARRRGARDAADPRRHLRDHRRRRRLEGRHPGPRRRPRRRPPRRRPRRPPPDEPRLRRGPSLGLRGGPLRATSPSPTAIASSRSPTSVA